MHGSIRSMHVPLVLDRFVDVAVIVEQPWMRGNDGTGERAAARLLADAAAGQERHARGLAERVHALAEIALVEERRAAFGARRRVARRVVCLSNSASANPGRIANSRAP